MMKKLEDGSRSRNKQTSICQQSPHLSRKTILDSLYQVYPTSVIFTIVPEYCVINSEVSEPQQDSEQEQEPVQSGPALPLSSSVEPPVTTSSAEPVPAFTSLLEMPFIQSTVHEPVTSLSSSSSSLPPLLSSIYDQNVSLGLTNEEIEEVCKDIFITMNVTTEQAENVFKVTKDQSESPLWFQHRLGRITSSVAHSVLRFTAKSYPSSIVKQVMQYEVLNLNIPALRWGREHESDARKEYLSIMSKTHVNFKVDLCGLVINPKYPYMAASPDGKCSCTCCGTHLIEIKCPYSIRNEDPNKVKRSNFYLSQKNGKLSLSKKHMYYSQVQHQLLISEEEACDFICWTPKGIFVENIVKDPDFKQNIPKFKTFFCTYLLPELLTHHFHDNGPKDVAQAVSSSDDSKMYCFCGKDKKGMMIACENPECTVEWYHYSCVGIRRKPKGSWFCPKCK